MIHDLFEDGWLGLLGLDVGLAVGHENGVLVHVVVVSVVAGVAELPAEEGDHQHAVEEPAGNGVDGKVLGERIMAAVVCKDPETSEETSLDEAV